MIGGPHRILEAQNSQVIDSVWTCGFNSHLHCYKVHLHVRAASSHVGKSLVEFPSANEYHVIPATCSHLGIVTPLHVFVCAQLIFFVVHFPPPALSFDEDHTFSLASRAAMTSVSRSHPLPTSKCKHMPVEVSSLTMPIFCFINLWKLERNHSPVVQLRPYKHYR